VYPSELENVLGAHPGVQAVAVVGRPDAYYGEEVVAFVVPALAPAPTPSELRAFMAPQLARHKLPREFVVVDRLPLGPSGKIQKRTLREMLASGQFVPQAVDAGR
jgi:feruloyl-CoA synthase